jgi:hypothetical protein
MGSSVKESSLTGIPRRQHIHAWNFPPDTTRDKVLEYIKVQKPDARDSSLEIEQLKVSRGSYASFSEDLGKDMLNPDFWPKNVYFGNVFSRKPCLVKLLN